MASKITARRIVTRTFLPGCRRKKEGGKAFPRKKKGERQKKKKGERPPKNNSEIPEKKEGGKSKNGLRKSCQNIGNPSQIEDNNGAFGASMRLPKGAALHAAPLGFVVFDLIRIPYVLA